MSAAAAARDGLGEGAGGATGGGDGGGGGILNRFVQLPGRPRAAGHRCPPARSGHRCVADSSNLYVFGGYNPDYDESGGPENEDYPLFRELWRYNFATDTWHQMGTEGYMPRELASMSLVLHGNNLLVFGGTGIPFGESNGNDVHVCNVKYKRWALLSCRGKKPNRIYGQAMAIINGCLYVFGGTTGYIYSTDLHKLDLNTREWTQLKPNNMSCDMPEERYRHEIAHDGQRIYILGGGTSWTAYSLDKIHAYNLETNTWEEITTKPHEKVGFPAARRCHSCVQIKNDVFVCGGYNGEVILGDVWKLNLQTFQWVKLPAAMPEPVYFHCAAVTPHFPVQRKMSPACHTLWTTPGASLTLLRSLVKTLKPGGPGTVRQDQAGNELELWEGHGESWSPQPPHWLCPWDEVTEDRKWWPQRGPGQ